jgi:hypothetical protein
MRNTLVVVLALLCACKKDTKEESKAGTEEKAVEAKKPDPAKPDPAKPDPAAKPKVDPWAGNAPAEAKTELGSKAGASLSKIDAKPSGLATGEPPVKVDPTTIEKPAAPQLELNGFTSGSGQETPGFSVTYNKSKVASHEQMREMLQQNRLFEQIAAGLNNTVRIPHNVAIQTVDCHTINAFYDPNTSRIIVCYELLDYFMEVFKPQAKTNEDLGNSVIGATIFSFYHETGHGLIHQLDLAAVGREEDSVDQLATLILIGHGESGVNMALSGAYWFKLQGESDHKTPFWDEHGFDGQRFYNIMCLIYGSNPDKYKSFVSSGDLPEARAQRCPDEYRKIQKAWDHLLQPYLTNGAATNIDYKPSVPVKEAPKTTKKDPWGDGEAGNSTPTTDPWAGSSSKEEEEEAKKPAPATTCEDVAEHAGELIQSDALERAKKSGPEAVEETERRLAAHLPAVKQKLIAECAKDHWSDAARTCVLQAKVLADATKCK